MIFTEKEERDGNTHFYPKIPASGAGGGKLTLDKDNVHLSIAGNTNISNAEMKSPARITTETFDININALLISLDKPSDKDILIDATIGKLELEKKANLILGANVNQLIVGKNAEKSLPSIITLLADNKEIKDVTAKIGDWKIKNGAFDGNTAGSYTFVGTVKIPDGYAYSNGTLTVTALNYTDSNGSTVNLGQEVATYTCTVGAPVSKADELPTLLTSGKDKANVYIRLKGTGTASVITVSDEADISAEETVNSSNSGLFQDSISVGSATTETDTTPPNFVVFLGMTVTSEQLPAVAVNSFDREEKNPHKTTSVTFTIPSDKVSLTNEGKTAGWYIPQGGLKLTA